MSTGMTAGVGTSVAIVAKARDVNGARGGTSSPSPRLRGEGRGEGALRESGPRGESPSPRPSPRENGEREKRLQPACETHAEDAETKALYRLMTWMSPSYPVGAFSYSGGIEWAVEAGDIRDAGTLRAWLATMIRDGGVFCDAAMFCHAHRAVSSGDDKALAATAELAAAFVGTKERFLETTAQGEAFRQITQAAWPTPALDRLTAAWDGPLAYPIVVAAACAGHGIALVPALYAFLHGVASNLISAGVRLIPLGQTDGQRVLAALEGGIAQAAARALVTALDDIGAATLRADIAGMRHETQYTRLFRS
jgi:urease accessory protein